MCRGLRRWIRRWRWGREGVRGWWGSYDIVEEGWWLGSRLLWSWLVFRRVAPLCGGGIRICEIARVGTLL